MIDPTAIVDTAARISDGVFVGPYCIVGPDVELGPDVRLDSHVVVQGRTRIGARTRIFPFASVGHEPQDRKYEGEASGLEIGADCVIREHVTVNPGTAGGGMATRIGDSCLILAGAHVAHDCVVGDRVTIVNHVLLGGHVVVGDYATIGGGAAIHQFVRIGAHAMVGGMSGVEHDVIPFGLVTGNRARLEGLNLVGLKRGGYARDEIRALQEAYSFLFSSAEPLRERAAEAERLFQDSQAVGEMMQFIRSPSRRAFCVPVVEAPERSRANLLEPAA
jgi:UDP-N-acetylglucosamine acyltransferase